MNTELTKELLSRLDALAAKLGIAADQLWAILVRQAHVEMNVQFAVGLLAFLVLLAAAGLFVYGARRGWGDCWDDEAVGSAFVGGLIAVLAFGIATFSWLDAYCIAMNPEYWAFKELVKLLGR